MRKIMIALSTLLALAMILTGCKPLVADEEKPLEIYASFYPVYALTEALMADVPDANLHCLVQPQDGCLRNYQLSDWDLYLLASADAVICGGRGLESFESLLFQWGDSGPAVSAVLYNLDLYHEEYTGDREDSHLDGDNPHLYMSVSGAKRMLESIGGALMTLDQKYAERYRANEARASAELDSLLEDMKTTAGRAEGQPVVLMNEALIYTAMDLGLEVAGRIERESGEALYGDQLARCVDDIRKSGARVVLLERQAPAGLVSALREAGYGVALIDVLSTHTENEGFETYFNAQRANAQAVAEAFTSIGIE